MKTEQVMFFIDGFNLFHSLDKTTIYPNETYFCQYKWLDLNKLCRAFIKKNQIISGIKYFTSIARWKNKESVLRHMNYIKALENVGIEIGKGKFIKKTKNCYKFKNKTVPDTKCSSDGCDCYRYITHNPSDQKCLECNCDGIVDNIQEKRVDVKIAVELIKNAAEDNYDIAVIVSGDSDYIPAVEYVKSAYPNKKICVAVPPGRKAEELREATDAIFQIKEIHLQTCQFPEKIVLSDQTILECPKNWKN